MKIIRPYLIAEIGINHNGDLNLAKKIIVEAKKAGLITVLWSYARGSLSKKGETAVNIISYAAHMACLCGAHIVKVKFSL